MRCDNALSKSMQYPRQQKSFSVSFFGERFLNVMRVLCNKEREEKERERKIQLK
jgi:hypothetical protein